MWRVSRLPEGGDSLYLIEKLRKIELSTNSILAAIVWALLIAVVFSPVVTAQSADAKHITATVIVDGQSWEFTSSRASVGGILKEAGVTLGAMDRVYPNLSTPPTAGMHIRVTRITQETVSQIEKINYKTRIKFNRRGLSEKTVVQTGKLGEKTVKYLVTYKDGVKADTQRIAAQINAKPVDEIVAVSNVSHIMLASRSGVRVPSMMMNASGYAPFVCGGSASGRTATGVMAGKGIVAVDPRVIRLGTQLYIEGYGYCVAGDTGGAIKGVRIDLGFDTRSQAMNFGRRSVRVYILER